MAKLIAHNLTVDFPLYSVKPSFKRMLVSTVGGSLIKLDDKPSIVRALNKINFDINDGDRVGLVGDNGSGKSTLLRVIAGVYEPTSGSISVEGKISSMLSLTPGMSDDLTGYENIYIRCYFLGIKKDYIDKIIDNVIEFAELGEFLNLPMRTYSSGMRMRLAFAIMVFIDTDILIMDEWLSVGDKTFIDKANKKLLSLIDKTSIFVIASHDKKMIKRQCNKIYYLKNGNLVKN